MKKIYKQTILVILILSITCFMLIAGFSYCYFNESSEYKVCSQLLAAIVYIQFYEKQYNQLPSNEVFNNWSEKNYQNWSFRYYPNPLDKKRGQNNSFIIGAWTGDEVQYFYSWEQTFRYENDHQARLKQLNGKRLNLEHN